MLIGITLAGCTQSTGTVPRGEMSGADNEGGYKFYARPAGKHTDYREPVPFSLCSEPCPTGEVCAREVSAQGPVGDAECLKAVDASVLQEEGNWKNPLVVRHASFELYDRDVGCKGAGCSNAGVAMRVGESYWPVRLPMEMDLIVSREWGLPMFPGADSTHVIGVVRPTKLGLDGNLAFDLLAYETSEKGPFIDGAAQPASYVVSYGRGSGPRWGAALTREPKARAGTGGGASTESPSTEP